MLKQYVATPDVAAQSWTANRSVGQNKPPFFMNYPASYILLEQQETD